MVVIMQYFDVLFWAIDLLSFIFQRNTVRPAQLDAFKTSIKC